MDKKYMTELDKIGVERKNRLRMLEGAGVVKANEDLYGPRVNDFVLLQSMDPGNGSVKIEPMDELVKRNEQRKKDGFTADKLKILSRPVGDGQFVQIPIVKRVKLVHGSFEPKQSDGTGGVGEEEEGEVIGEKEMEEQGTEQKPGDKPGEHGLDPETVKDIEDMIENEELPDWKDKGKRVPVDEYTYELGDVFRGRGQRLHRKKTERNIIETNYLLGRLDINNPDPRKFYVPREDLVYNIFSMERKYKSQAKVFFCRDYSGSMSGRVTEAVVGQQMMLYWWLMKIYGEKLIEPYFILHDTDATQVFNFEDYFYATVNGGTQVSACFKLVNKIIEEQNLAQDFNLFLFYGTDGDDWDDKGVSAVPKLKKLLDYVNRAGVVIIKHDGSWMPDARKKEPTTVEKYINESKLLETHKQSFRMFTMAESQIGRAKNLEAVKKLIAK